MKILHPLIIAYNYDQNNHYNVKDQNCLYFRGELKHSHPNPKSSIMLSNYSYPEKKVSESPH